jgi:hypothetical protein
MSLSIKLSAHGIIFHNRVKIVSMEGQLLKKCDKVSFSGNGTFFLMQKEHSG